MADVEVIDFSDWAAQLKYKSIPEIKRNLRGAHVFLSVNELAFERSRGNMVQPVSFVDNLPKKKLTNVKFGGRIEFKDQAVFASEETGAGSLNVAKAVIKMLRSHSPSLHRAYKNNHHLFYNGQPYPANANPPLEVASDTLMFVNSMPYAKRLEGVIQPAKTKFAARQRANINKTNRANKGRIKSGFAAKRVPTSFERAAMGDGTKYTNESMKYMSVQSPNGIYTLVAKKLQRIYRGRLLVNFTYLPLSQFYNIDYGQANERGGAGGRWARTLPKYIESNRPTVFPVILISLDYDTAQLDTSALN